MRFSSLVVATVLAVIPLASSIALSQWRVPLNAMSPIHVFGEAIEAITTNNIRDDFFERAADLGQKLQDYANDRLREASRIYEDAATKIEELAATVSELVVATHHLTEEMRQVVEERGHTLQEDFSTRFSEEMAVVLEVMKKEFPNPKEAPNHEERQKMVSSVLDRVEDRFLHLLVQYGQPEERARKSFERIKPIILKTTVIIGKHSRCDLTEQHPVLLETMLFSITAMIIPQSFILRPILSLFGFGPYGPIKGSTAAWAQRRFWGAAVVKDSWFSRLQQAGMKAGSPWKIWDWIKRLWPF